MIKVLAFKGSFNFEFGRCLLPPRPSSESAGTPFPDLLRNAEMPLSLCTLSLLVYPCCTRNLCSSRPKVDLCVNLAGAEV